MMSVYASTATLTFGKCSLNFSTTFHSPQLLKTKSSVCMVVFLRQSTHLTKLDNWTVFKKCLKKALCAICSGLILTIDAVGAFLHVVLATVLDKIYQNSLTTQTALHASLVLIN